MKHARADYDEIQDPREEIPEDEPVFILRGQDVCTPVAMQAYIDSARFNGATENFIAAIDAHLVRVNEWQRDVKKKVPDMPEGEALEKKQSNAAAGKKRK